MTSINPSDQPPRRVEIVPLPAAEGPSAPTTALRSVWRSPTIDTVTYERAFAPRPDLTQRVWVVSPEPKAAPATPPSPAQSRLQALLHRERDALLAAANDQAEPSAHAPRVDHAAAPFPLPAPPRREISSAPVTPSVRETASIPETPAAPEAHSARDTPRQRTPKPVRAGASAKPLAADVAAAIARATGHEQPPPPAPRLSLVRRLTARERIEIVPLGDPLPAEEPSLDHTPEAAVEATPTSPTTAPTPEPKHRIIDLRERRRLRGRAPVVYLCPNCEGQGVVDLIDTVTHRVSATCPRCQKMWTTDLQPDHLSIDPH